LYSFSITCYTYEYLLAPDWLFSVQPRGVIVGQLRVQDEFEAESSGFHAGLVHSHRCGGKEAAAKNRYCCGPRNQNCSEWDLEAVSVELICTLQNFLPYFALENENKKFQEDQRNEERLKQEIYLHPTPKTKRNKMHNGSAVTQTLLGRDYEQGSSESLVALLVVILHTVCQLRQADMCTGQTVEQQPLNKLFSWVTIFSKIWSGCAVSNSYYQNVSCASALPSQRDLSEG